MRQSHCVFAVAERHEPYELRGSRTVLWGSGGAIPPLYPAPANAIFELTDFRESLGGTLMVQSASGTGGVTSTRAGPLACIIGERCSCI